MANRYFTYVKTLVAFARARADDVEAKFQTIESAFGGVQDEVDKAIRLPDVVTTTFPSSAARANKAIIFNALGQPTLSADNYVDQVANATTQATNAANSAASAAGSASAASGSAGTAAAAATSATNSATAAAGSATSAAGSATSASNSAATATTKAGEAAASATNAATSATNAGNSAAAASGFATNASTSATNAAGSATQSANSATASGTSATNAAGSATAAAGSATSAAASAATAVAAITAGLKNSIINGDMRVDRRNNGAEVTANNSRVFVTDRWRVVAVAGLNTGTFAGQRLAAPAGFPFAYALRVQTTGAKAAAAADAFFIEYNGEGHDFARYRFGSAAALAFTDSFWVQSSIAGDYTLAYSNVDGSREYLTKFNIAAANTPQLIKVTVPGDVAGVWDNITGVGLRRYIDLGSGANLISPNVNTWSTIAAGSNRTRLAGTVNFIATQAATFFVSGVQIELGSTATPFEHRPIELEEALCRRYFERLTYGNNVPISTGQAFTSSDALAPFSFSKKRGAPTIAFAGTVTALTAAGAANAATINFVGITDNAARISVVSNGLVGGNATAVYVTSATSNIDINAEF